MQVIHWGLNSGIIPVGSEEGRIGQKEKLDCDEVVTEPLPQPKGGSRAERDPQSCPKLRQEG